MTNERVERDSMGEVRVPIHAAYGAQTQRAVDNFPISGIRFGRDLISALGLIKQAAARVNRDLETLPEPIAEAIDRAAQKVVDGSMDDHFPIDVFQTGSGTSTNMNANEVIAHLAQQEIIERALACPAIHPNDHVNFGQSSNDVFPTAIRVAAVLAIHRRLFPALDHLEAALRKVAHEHRYVVKTGRTHLMDAMPLTLAQEFGGYARQIHLGKQRIADTLDRLTELPQGGTAVGTGINTHPRFGKRFAAVLSDMTGIAFVEAEDHFEAQACVDAPAETSAQLKTVACSMMKIANDLRWMNSGPNSGLAEIRLPPLQPGSSIMPGKVNPVIEESVAMVCAQVIGNDAAITIAAQSGNFELNVMLPLVAHNLLQSIDILANAARNQADRSLAGLVVNVEHLRRALGKNPILATALNPLIGYDAAAKIAKQAFAEGRSIRELAQERTQLTSAELDRALDPERMTRGGM